MIKHLQTELISKIATAVSSFNGAEMIAVEAFPADLRQYLEQLYKAKKGAILLAYKGGNNISQEESGYLLQRSYDFDVICLIRSFKNNSVDIESGAKPHYEAHEIVEQLIHDLSESTIQRPANKPQEFYQSVSVLYQSDQFVGWDNEKALWIHKIKLRCQ